MKVNEFSEALNFLSTRSFGGIDVAVDPTSASVSDAFFGTGPLPSGVEESASWFLEVQVMANLLLPTRLVLRSPRWILKIVTFHIANIATKPKMVSR